MLSKQNFHFIGAYGVSMSGIIKHLLSNGKTVTGSDKCENERYKELSTLGAKISLEHRARNVKRADVVVFSSAIKDDNPELAYAKRKGICTVKRSQILNQIMKGFNRSIAVSGSHGKTTATAMIANALIKANKDPTVFLGGDDYGFGNYRKGANQVVVLEACEYEKNILDLKPNLSVVLNIDNDHMDSYKDMTDMLNAFYSFTKNTLTVINADDPLASKLFNATTVTFGIENRATFGAKNLRRNDFGYTFTALLNNRPLGTINLKVAGRHNVYNALSAIAVCSVMQIPFYNVKRTLENFKGVRRRNEYLGRVMGLDCYADYAHHPKEISATLTSYSESGKDFITVFQPHTYSRTKNLMDDFVKVLKDQQPLIVYKTYSAREKFDQDGSAKTLYDAIYSIVGDNCKYCQNQTQLLDAIKEYSSGQKRVVFMGAGDVYEKAKALLEKK